MEKVGYLGPEGSYSKIAAERLCKGGELIPYANFRTLFSALTEGKVSAIVAPISNTVNGAVVQNLDLMEECEGLYAVALTTIPVDHRLITREGADLSKIKRIYSHPQALEQCSRYLAENFPQAVQIATSSTAESLKTITDDACAGIVGSHVRAQGFKLSDEIISDEKSNSTNFFKIIKGDYEAVNSDGKKYLFCLTLKHEVGSLCNALKIIEGFGVNMTDIESRPIKD
ncbi:MAG: hypothetical protein K2N47_05805, partial [Clostridia bacterium]|nr:hypothetical protein [Clostridia bacterium]